MSTHFAKWALVLSILVLGGLAWYGLHNDIQGATNPCVTDTRSFACAKYACGIGQYLPIPASEGCRAVLGQPRRASQ